LLLLFSASSFVQAENRSENVKNTVSATANSGGNTISGSGTIRTGDASATVEAKNYVNGGKDIENKVEAKAEGEKAEVSINGESKNCQAEEGENCSVEMENNIASVGENTAETVKGEEAEKNIANEAGSFWAKLAKSVMDKIGEWLG